MTSSLSSHVVLEGRETKVDVKMLLGMPTEAAWQDLRTLEPALHPAGKNAVAPLVARLKARTKSRDPGDQGARFAAEVLVDDLARYPVDVVHWVCEEWVCRDDGKWFPAWAELRDLAERRVQPRQSLEKALRWVLAGEPDTADWKRKEGQFVPEPYHVRIRAMRDSFKRIGNLAKAAHYEHLLADLEGREPADWAQRPVGASVPSPRPPFTPEQSPSAKRCAELAKAFHKPAEKPAET